MGLSRIELEIEPKKAGVAIVFADGRKVEVHSDWKPGDPLWRGTVDGVDIAVQARPILNGYALVPCRGRGRSARLHPPRG